MNIINRYLAREIYTTLFVVSMVLIVIFLSNQCVRYMHAAAIGNLSGSLVRMLLLLHLPILTATLLPASLFFAILLAYGRLYADNEMTILISCGINPSKILLTTLRFTSVVVVFISLLSLLINPEFYKYSDRILSVASSASSLEVIKPNIFTPVANDRWIFYIGGKSEGKESFTNVFSAQQLESESYDVDRRSQIIMAKKVHQKIDGKTGDIYVVLTDGYRYVGVPGRKDYEIMKYDEYAVRIKKDIKLSKTDASSISTLQLWRERSNKFFAAELQWRISLPLSAIILIILGVPLSKIKPRYGRFAKLVPAILLYIIYANLLFLARTWVRNGVVGVLVGMWWVHIIMLGIAFLLIYQPSGYGRFFSSNRWKLTL